MKRQGVFNRHRKADIKSSPNKKGEGFQFFALPKNQEDLKRQAIMGTACGLVVLLGTLIAIGKHSTPDFVILTCALMTLCSMTLYNILGRQIQDKKTDQHICDLTETQDRLIRQTARNRSDIEKLMERQMREANEKGQVLDLTQTASDSDLNNRDNASTRDQISFHISPVALGKKDASRKKHKDQAFSSTIIEELLNRANSNDNIDVFMQPVFRMPEKQIQFYEIFGRIHAGQGQYISAENYLNVAEQQNNMVGLDTLLLTRILKIIQTKTVYGGRDVPFILNTRLKTLKNRAFINELITFIARNQTSSSRLIFEFPHQDLMDASQKDKSLLKHLRQLGCRFSVDNVQTRDLNLGLLKGCSVGFIKMDSEWVRQETLTDNGFNRMIKIKNTLQHSGIQCIAQKTESDIQLRLIDDVGIDLAQGRYLKAPHISSTFIKPVHQGTSFELRDTHSNKTVSTNETVSNKQKNAETTKAIPYQRQAFMEPASSIQNTKKYQSMMARAKARHQALKKEVQKQKTGT